ncbi:uncharacterized protein EI90DRAFT_2973517 [Cantharellus anzutake]|uniref:uncharacterized protein n=1 Tax=Cantharellus anzutake TaxID=1750568 RepID=UPI0019048AA6|nr:uncharacterized protein EI90DRAFT_2973517 [Cantharellus anzutake]KAF8329845.1 hypothetical protein EI90DRAFT_2973517 [Cantharellus anzutake]
MRSVVTGFALLNVLVLLAAIACTQVPLLKHIGFFTRVRPVGNTNCTIIEGPESCEKIVVHHSSGLVYMACGTLDTRWKWAPFFQVFEEPRTKDVITIYDPTANTLRPIRHDLKDFRGLNVHGMDVVQSSDNPKTLYIYLVNHRPQLRRNEHAVGADSTIELFKTEAGSERMKHIKTFHDPKIILTPNDVAGSPDGKSFYFTNDHSSRVDPWERRIQLWFNPSKNSLGYCHIDKGCKIAAANLPSPNGIVRINDDTYWVAGFPSGKITVFTRDADNSLVQVDEIDIGRPLDNLTVDENGDVWVAAFVRLFETIKYVLSRGGLAPSAAYKVSLNQGYDAYFGKKYAVKKVFEDDGTLANWITTAAADSRRRQLYLHGLFSKHLVRCPF